MKHRVWLPGSYGSKGAQTGPPTTLGAFRLYGHFQPHEPPCSYLCLLTEQMLVVQTPNLLVFSLSSLMKLFYQVDSRGLFLSVGFLQLNVLQRYSSRAGHILPHYPLILHLLEPHLYHHKRETYGSIISKNESFL